MAKTKTVTFSYNPHYKDAHDGSSSGATSPNTTPPPPAPETLRLSEAGQYTEASAVEDGVWFSRCVELATALRDWRKTYKQLEQRKRQLKKAGSKETKSSPLSSQMKDEEHSQTPDTPETSANDHESESDQARPHKRRRTGL